MKPSGQHSLGTKLFGIGWAIKAANKAGLYSICKDLAKEFCFAKKRNSAARQASAERAWAAIFSFYQNNSKFIFNPLC